VQCLGEADTLLRFTLQRKPSGAAVQLDTSFTAAEVYDMLLDPEARLVAVVRAARERCGAHCPRAQALGAPHNCVLTRLRPRAGGQR
jgi:hypothetical protein